MTILSTTGSIRPLGVGTNLADARTMIRRSLGHIVRYPSMTLMLLFLPIVFLLLFVYVFGGALGANIGAGLGAGTGRAAYANYVASAIPVMTVAAGAQGP